MKCSKVILKAIESDSRSNAQIARESDVHPSLISRFVNGKRGLTTGAMDRLCQTLKLQLTLAKKEATDGR